MEWIFLPYKRYADFSGRSQRKEYWLFQLLLVMVIVVAVLPFFATSAAFESNAGAEPELSGFAIAGAVLLGIFVLGSIIPSIAVTVRRFHDQDKSGWFYLLSFIPYVGGWIVFVFMCLDGTHGENKYGPDPKGTGIDTHVFD